MLKAKIFAQILTSLLALGGGAAIAFGISQSSAYAPQWLFVGAVAVFVALAGVVIILCSPPEEQEPDRSLGDGWYNWSEAADGREHSAHL